MDGTLLDENMEISHANVSAIKRAQSQGIHFAIATGRHSQWLIHYLKTTIYAVR